jgi:hypothetical protein
MEPMTRNDLPIVVIQICFQERRQYLGRLATVAEFEEYRKNCGFQPGDLDYEVWDVRPQLTKDEAMQKWGHYTDSAIRSSGLSLEKQMESLVAAGATEDSLKTFWLEVKRFCWPGSYGQSPWDIASCLGASLEARDLGPEFRAVGMRYVEPFRLAFLAAEGVLS